MAKCNFPNLNLIIQKDDTTIFSPLKFPISTEFKKSKVGFP